MRYAFLVAWREYIENIKTKGFWIGILLFPVILFLSVQIPVFLERKGTPIRHFVLIDQSGDFAELIEKDLARSHRKRVVDALQEHAKAFGQTLASPTGSVNQAALTLQQLLSTEPDASADTLLARVRPHLTPHAPDIELPRARFTRVPLPRYIDPSAPLTELATQLKPFLDGTQRLAVNGQHIPLHAAILIPANVTNMTRRSATVADPEFAIQYWSANLADQSLRDEIERSIQAEVRRREYLARGVDLSVVQQIEQTRVPITVLDPKKEKGAEAVGRADILRQWAPAGFVYLLWIAIFSISQMLLNNTIEEKSNRVLEVLLSSVTPGELMMGKLAGIAAVGLTMTGAWMSTLAGFLITKTGGGNELPVQLLSILKTTHLLPAFFLYFILGYLMYSGLILAIGSICNTLKEAQNYMGVITMLLIVPLLTMSFIPKDPNGTLATLLSWIPLYTPFVMMNRAMADPPLFDLIGTTVLLILSTALILWMAVRIFRVGVLRTGQPPRLVELIRWIRGGGY